MNNNYNSNDKNGKGVSNKDNDDNNIISLILINNVFCCIMLEDIKNNVFIFIEIGILHPN